MGVLYMAFGDRLKEARNAIGMSRIQLAEKLGVTPSAISNYENGISSPKEDIMLKIFDILSVEPNFLFKDSVMSLNNSNLDIGEKRIINDYQKLNRIGKSEAEKRINELTYISKYTEK